MTKLFQRKSKSQLSPLHLRLLLTGGEVVAEGVGIHGKHALSEEGLVLVVDGDLGELSGKVGLEALLVGSGIVDAVGLVAVEHVEGDVVAGEKFVAFVDFGVHPLGNSLKELGLGEVGEFVDPGVDGGCGTIDHTALVAENACLHIVEVVLS